MDFQTLIDTAIWAAGAAGALWGMWLAFRKRIKQWWSPFQDAIEGAKQLPRLTTDVETLTRMVHLQTMHLRARSDTDIATAQFETDAEGANTYVNLTFARWLGVGKNELMGWGWVNFVHPDDRIRVRAEWDLCREEHRKYSIRFRMLDSGGEVITVDVLAIPVPESPPAKQWLGVIRRVVE